MIIWIASYPKSGNTYIRSFIASYFFSKKGKFSLDLLPNILQFPSVKFTKKNIYSKLEAAQSWIYNQNNFFSDNKIHFLKTHSSLDKFKGYEFTSNKQTLAAIYIVRDPRNVITSMTNHYSLSYEDAFSKMLDKESSLLQKVVDTDYSGYTHLGSWSSHYKSWKNMKEFKILFIKYEDLENYKYETFTKIVNFINNCKNDGEKINEKKLINSIRSTNFTNLQNLEKREGFEESIYSKNTGEKINFFHLGFNNRWKKILPKEILHKLNNAFQKDINELGYEEINE
jgi:hypothetical protein|tara:strand:+ start:500 stop:1351 length:852 start_codon:yes stop_codon:yes gene_type:complete